MSQSVSAEQRRAIEWDCTQLLVRAAMLNDAADFDGLAALFTEDAEFVRPMNPETALKGRDAIRASYNRPEGRITQHFVTNMLIEPLGPTKARGRSYMLVYMAWAKDDLGKLGAKAEPRQLVSQFDDEFVLTADGWRFSRRLGRFAMATE